MKYRNNGFALIIMFSFLTLSCGNWKDKSDSGNIIPDKDLVSLLTDIYLTNGLLAIPKINSYYSSLDSISTYYQVIEKHGYTKEMMDRTMRYYFINNPKKLNKIYDQVLGNLSNMQSRAEKQAFLEQNRNANLWRGKEFYVSPAVSGGDSTTFNLSLSNAGYYYLTFSTTLFPDDQSLNPKAILYTTSPDSISSGKRRYFSSIEYIKDGRRHIYSIQISVPAGKVRHLSGRLIDFANRPDGIENHFLLENISLNYSLMAL